MRKMKMSKAVEIGLCIGFPIGFLFTMMPDVIENNIFASYMPIVGYLIYQILMIVFYGYLWLVNNQFALFFKE